MSPNELTFYVIYDRNSKQYAGNGNRGRMSPTSPRVWNRKEDAMRCMGDPYTRWPAKSDLTILTLHAKVQN